MATEVTVKNQKSLTTRLWSMKIAEEFCDATVLVDGKTIPVHKVVLASASGYFKNLFKKSPQNVVTFQNVDTNALELLLKYCYSGKIKITLDNANEVLTLARILSMKAILDQSVKVFEKKYSFDQCFSKWNIDQMGVVEKLHGKQTCITGKALVSSDSNEKSKTTDTLEVVQQKSTKINSDENIDINDRKSIDPVNTLAVVGGYSLIESKTLEIFDSINKKWISFDIDYKYVKFSSVFLNNKIFFIGGINRYEETVNDVNYYDLKSGKLEKCPPMKYPRFNHRAVQCDNFIFVIGGRYDKVNFNFVEKYNPAINEWTEVAPMIIARQAFAVEVLNHSIYVVGGFGNKDYLPISSTEVYSITENQWKLCASMHLARIDFGLASVRGYLYAVGGFNGARIIDSIEKYDPSIDRWFELDQTINPPRYALSAINFMGKVLIAGGSFSVNVVYPMVEMFNPQTNEFEQMTYLNRVRGHFSLVGIPWNLAKDLISRKQSQ